MKLQVAQSKDHKIFKLYCIHLNILNVSKELNMLFFIIIIIILYFFLHFLVICTKTHLVAEAIPKSILKVHTLQIKKYLKKNNKI